MGDRTAIVIIHGIGEQIPMATLTGFIDTVWAHDESLVDAEKPDPNTGNPRTSNASWSKPDERNRSFELQLVTTESDRNKRRYDFFEYYWAHRVTGTTWEQVRAWILGLMLRNPFTNVPKGVRPAWLILWLLLSLVLYASAVAGLAAGAEEIEPSTSQYAPIRWTLTLAAWIQTWQGWQIAIAWGAVTLASGLILKIMVDVAGDVVRYVEATPKNIAIRQSIRENGVRLIETLMGIDEHGTAGKADYDRIIVVGHSLGTIVAFDILTHVFGRHNDRIDQTKLASAKQDKRAKLETMVREGLEGRPGFTLEAYRGLQQECREELNALGNPWIVSDFISLGSPLTHAEFLLAADRDALETAKQKRILPTCPPTLEYDRSTKLLHFTYRSPDVRKVGDGANPLSPRVPHHAALFAYTRWTNIYSPLRFLLVGDIVSGPLCKAFGLARPGKTPLCGIHDIAVLPTSEAEATDHDRKRRLLTHLKYWDLGVARSEGANIVPFHIRALRNALNLARKG
jgi:hypothetical protein